MSPNRQIHAESHATLVFSGRLVRGRETDELLAQGTCLLAKTDLWLDLSSVAAVDGAGLGVLVGLHNTARANRRGLYLISPSAPVGSILRLTGLDGVLTLGPRPVTSEPIRLGCCAD
jgi:anti-anti-sigma factor